MSHPNSPAGEGELTVEETRRALVTFLTKQRTGSDASSRYSDEAGSSNADPHQNENAKRPESVGEFKWASLLTAAASAWWNEHPARAVAIVLRSATEELVRSKPLPSVGVAALVGAGIVVLRPWRLVPVAAIALRLVRGSSFASFAASAIASATRLKADR